VADQTMPLKKGYLKAKMVAIEIELRTGLKKLPYHHAIWNIIMYLRVYLYIYIPRW
jgi:hypothetical protein